MYIVRSGGFIGCPADAHEYANHLCKKFENIPRPGGVHTVNYWKKVGNVNTLNASVPTQHTIARTSHAEVSPVFILLKNSIGSPVVEPPEGWSRLRKWLNRNGFGYISLLGDQSFTDRHSIPDGTVPLTGTLFELFDALSSDSEKEVRILNINQKLKIQDETDRRQRDWTQKILSDLESAYTVIKVDSFNQFESMSAELIENAFGLPKLDPFSDPLPGLSTTHAKQHLFGRERLVTQLVQRVTSDSHRLSVIVGVSGVGKSSLLYAGLLPYLSPDNIQAQNNHNLPIIFSPLSLCSRSILPQHPNHAEEILGLATLDPLQYFANLLNGTSGENTTLISSPFSKENVIDPPFLTGDYRADIIAAMHWWMRVFKPVKDRLIIVIDQAEQVQLIARRAQALQAEKSVDLLDEPSSLSPGWWRFCALLALLGGNAQFTFERGSEFEKFESFLRDHPVSLLLSIHRRKSLRLWPLDPSCLDDPFTVNPISDAKTIERIISGTFMLYGFTLETQLLNKMVGEAAELADEFTAIRTPDPDTISVLDSTKKASVLPLIATAMGNMISHWRQLSTPSNRASNILTLDTYAEVSVIATSVQTLGEKVWSEVQQSLSHLLSLDAQSHFDIMALNTAHCGAFDDLMAMLVDTDDREGIELAFMPRWLSLNTSQDTLRLCLSKHRLLVGVGERYWRLPHRTLLEHWDRAFRWADTAKRRLKAKTELRAIYRLSTSGCAVAWTNAQHEGLIELGLFWIGGNTGVDAELKRWLYNELVSNLDTAALDPDADSPVQRLPFDAMLEQRWELAAPMIERCINAKISKEHLGLMLAIACQYNYQPILNRLLSKDAFPDTYIDTIEPHTGYFPLLMAVNFEHAALCEQLLVAGANPNLYSPRTRSTALIQACELGNRVIVEMLLSHGAELELSEDCSDSTPLIAAVCSTNEKLVSFLLQLSVDIHQRHPRTGDSSLHVACSNGCSDIVSLLLKQHSDPNDINPESEGTPLMLAAYSGAAASVQLLLKAGADVDHVHVDTGETALALASGLGHLNVVALLLAHGTNSMSVNPKSGNTPLLFACEFGHEKIVNLLLEHGAAPDPDEAEGGVFPLLLAARYGSDQSVSYLLESGADPCRESLKSGNFALLLAADYGHDSIVNTLIEAGEHVDRRNTKNQSTALLLAAETGQTNVVSTLIDRGANVNLVNMDTGESALQFAAMNNHVGVMALLLKHGANSAWPRPSPGTDSLFFAAQSGYYDALELLLTHPSSAHFDVNNIDVDGHFALLIAAQENHVEVVRLLLSHGADPNQINPVSGAFPLLIAAQFGHHEVVELLLRFKANPNQIDPKEAGFPLVNAAQEGHVRTVEILLDFRASHDQYDTIEGSTALSASIEQGHLDVVERLINISDINFINPVTGETPLGVSIRTMKQSSELAKLLIDNGADVHLSVNRDGDSPLIAAVEHDRADVVTLLLKSGVDRSSLPQQLMTRLEEISEGRKVRPIDPSDTELRITDETVNVFENYQHIAKAFNSHWTFIDENEKSQKMIVETVERILELPFVIAETALHEKLDTQLTPGVSVIRTTYRETRQKNENIYIERIWLRPSLMTLSTEINATLNLDGIIHDYEKLWKTLDLRSPSELFLLASLVLLTSRPTRIPVTPEMPIQSHSGKTIDRFNFDNESWRVWNAMPFQGGQVVVLPWVFEQTLFLGKVIVTYNGIGSRILEESEVICDEDISINWLE